MKLNLQWFVAKMQHFTQNIYLILRNNFTQKITKISMRNKFNIEKMKLEKKHQTEYK